MACESSTIDKFPDPGHVFVTVTDQNNEPVEGATIALILPDNSLVWRSAVTDATGHAGPGESDGGVLPGNYNAKITPPSGYIVPGTQQNPIPITVQSNKSVSLSHKLTKNP